MRKSLLALFISATSSLSLLAQDPIDKVINTILANNPQIASEKALIVAQANDDADANSLGATSVDFARVWGNHGIGNKLQLDVSQEFDWPGLYAARRRASQQGVNAAEMQVVSNALNLSFEAKNLLLELIYVRKQLELQNVLLSDMKKMEEAADKGCEKGLITVLDHRKLAIETYKITSAIAALDSRQQQIIAQLQGMNSGTPLNLGDVTAYPIEQVLPREDYIAQVDELDPQIMANKFSMEQESLNAKAATQSRLPGFSVGYQHQAEMGDRFNGFTVGVKLPFFENRKAKAAALARMNATELSSESYKLQRITEINQHFADLDLWHKQVDGYLKTFGDNQYLTLLRKAYEGGEINIIDYLQEVSYYNEITFAYLEAEYNYQIALACLNRYNLITKNM